MSEAARARDEPDLAERAKRAQPRLSPYIACTPTLHQQAALRLDHLRELLYGGAAGGGKSELLLMAALQFSDVPGYSALLLRRTFPMLSQPDGLIDRAHEWLDGTDANWSEQKARWTFPSGAILQFGHLQRESDKYNYQGGGYRFVGFDELTQFTRSQYTYLFSRVRRLMGSGVPSRIWSASNPGGVGHAWVNQRFRVERSAERAFLTARLEDNPHLDRDDYVGQLMELHPHERRQLLEGDWESKPPGALFEREWFRTVERAPSQVKRRVRYWDLAATAARQGADPDHTAGVLMSSDGAGGYCVEHVRRFRRDAADVQDAIHKQAEVDGRAVSIVIEQEPGSSGKFVVDSFVRRLAGFTVRGDRVTGKKAQRAGPLASQAEAGHVSIVAGPWTNEYLDELEVFTGEDKGHDDQVDATTGAFGQLHTAGVGWADLGYGKRDDDAEDAEAA